MIGTISRYVSSLKYIISEADRTKRDVNKAFLTAIRNGQYDDVKNILELHLDKIDINGYIDDDSKCTPLWEACWTRHDARIAALLLEYGADPNHGQEVVERNGEYYSSIPYWPISLASNVTEEILSPLLTYGFDPNAINRNSGWSLLHLHCRNADYDKIELLLRHGANPNQTNRYGESPMFYMLNRYDDFGRWRGDDSVRHPNHFCLNDNHLSCLRLLLEYGADPNVIEPQWGMTPLFKVMHHATGECRLDFIRLMMQHGADFTIPLAVTPPRYARCPNCFEGDTILHYAVRLCDVDTIRLMTESQAITKFWWVRNHNGDTVYDMAGKLKAMSIIQYLDRKWRQICYAYLRYDWIQSR